MKEKQLRKQLMAIGVQRNDAAGFIRAYRVIQKAKKQGLCKDIMNPPMAEILIDDRPQMLQRLRVQYAAPNEALHGYGIEGRKLAENRIKEELAQGMARLLIDEAAVLFQQERIPEGHTVFRAEIRVAMPEKKVRRG